MTDLESPATMLPGVDAAIELVPLFRGIWTLTPYVVLPEVPVGTRAIIGIAAGRLEGRGVSARTVGGANADWLTVGPEGTATADWRGTVETDDGVTIFLHGTGRCDLSAGFGAGAVLIGAAVFEASDEHYRWLNRVHAIFRGVVVGDGVGGAGTYHDEYFEVR